MSQAKPEWTAEPGSEPESAPPAPAERRRSKTMSRKEMARELRRRRLTGEVDPEEQELLGASRQPAPHRADCVNGPRPCSRLLLTTLSGREPETGSIKLNFPDREVWELEETCALDVADKGGITLEEVGAIMNLTRERIRQVETRGLPSSAIAEDEGVLRVPSGEARLDRRRLSRVAAGARWTPVSQGSARSLTLGGRACFVPVPSVTSQDP
jgi:hypothetical protein